MIDVTIIIITYKSEKIIYDFIKKIPSNIKTIIIENSQNHNLKKDIEKKFKNIKFYITENNGVSSSINFAVDRIETKYFLQISPDIDFNFEDLKMFVDFAQEKKNRFAALGPRFLKVKEKSHKQIDENLEFGKIDSVHGSCMFINKESFLDIGKFDENIFLYFEETEFCYRAKKKNYFSYQINKSKVNSIGRSVEIENDNSENFSNILAWHFIWSKYYFNKKRYGKFLSLVIFIPLIIRILFRITLYKITKNDLLLNRYRTRFDGLLKSIKGEKSSLRP